jgi:hypothetical protein
VTCEAVVFCAKHALDCSGVTLGYVIPLSAFFLWMIVFQLQLVHIGLTSGSLLLSRAPKAATMILTLSLDDNGASLTV